MKQITGQKIIEKQEYADIPAQNTRNQLYRVYDQAGMVQFETFDFMGNPITEIRFVAVEHTTIIDHSETIPYETTSFVKTHSFDAMGRMITEVLPDNTIQQYSYNKAGLLEKVETKVRGVGSYAEYISNINYNARGQRTEVYFANNTKTKYEYDTNNFRLVRLLTTRNAGADILQDLNYTYDAAGNIVEMEDNAQQTHYFNNSVIEPKAKYWYDALYRLVKATGRENEAIAAAPGQADLAASIGIPFNNGANHLKNYTQSFAYDKLGNMLFMKDLGQWTRNYYYDAVNKNRLVSHDDENQIVQYTYDSQGNMLNMPGIPTMEWDYANQLHKAVSGTTTSFYNYDSTGNRIRKVVEKQDGIKEVRIYCGNFEVFRKYQNNVLIMEHTTTHICDENGRIATTELLTIENGNPVNNSDIIRYQYSNHLGSASLELDENANIISYEEYHPFGTSAYRLHRNDTEANLKRYRYVGKERDEETGLYYYGARYYAPWIARFVSVDPMAMHPKNIKHNPYCYVTNNPLNKIDPTGMEWDDANTEKFVKGFRGEIENKRSKLNEAITSNNDKISKLDKDSSKLANYNEENKIMESKLAELKVVEDELLAMEENEKVKFKIESIQENPFEQNYVFNNGKAREVIKNDNTTFRDGKIVMKFAQGSFDSMAHELKHGYQFLKGEISFSRDEAGNVGGGLLYDLTDEQAAWKRGSLFSAPLKSPVEEPTIEKLKGMDSYKGIYSSTALDMTSTIEVIERETGIPLNFMNKKLPYGQYTKFLTNEINRLSIK